MNDTLNALLLLFVPGLPLLLAFPALRQWLPWRGLRYLSVLPAVIVIAVIPASYSVEPSWLLFSVELGIETGSRLLLAVSVLLWIWLMLLLPVSKKQAEDRYFTVFLMLTMAGNFGVILATDLVAFFVFSTLLGYGFYGLLASADNNREQRAGRVYLILLIVADIALFEVLLITSMVTDTLGFAEVHHAMAQSDSLALYLALVVFAFVVKAGIWPFHFWLVHAFRCVRPVMALLLLAVPVTIALLGMLRWLPLGEITVPEAGLFVQGIGAATLLYAIVFAVLDSLKKKSLSMLSIHGVLLATAVFTIGIGTVLADATVWNYYQNWLYYFIASLALVLAILLSVTGWLHHNAAATAEREDEPDRWFERWPAIVLFWIANAGFHTLPRWRSWWLAKIHHLRLLIRLWKRQMGVNERILQGWGLAITLFLLLAMSITFVVASVGLSSSI